MTPKRFFIPISLLLFAGCGSPGNEEPIAQSTPRSQELSQSTQRSKPLLAEEREALLSTLSSERQLLQEALQSKTARGLQKPTTNSLVSELATERSKLQQALIQEQGISDKSKPSVRSDAEQRLQEALRRQAALQEAVDKIQPE